jgi:hypothetical protein
VDNDTEFDMQLLAGLIRGKGMFADGAIARMQDIPLRETEKRWMNGWEWADRILKGLELFYGGSEASIGTEWHTAAEG